MNIVWLIGNGFDINLGLKTEYSHFYKYYCNHKDQDIELIRNFKKTISGDIDNWSDLELALGEYAANLKNVQDYLTIIRDIKQGLSNYLDFIQDDFTSSFDYNYSRYCLNNPEEYLTSRHSNIITEYKKTFGRPHKITTISFNYTTVFEESIDCTNGNIYRNSAINIQTPLHIHGYHNRDIVLGVEDLAQISNQEFHSSQELIDSFIKSECNDAMENDNEEYFSRAIREADLICIFGSSLGQTDARIWYAIIERMIASGRCRLIIFEKTKPIDPLETYRRRQISNITRAKILNYIETDELTIKSIESRIHVGLNSDIFNKSDMITKV